MTKIFEIIFCGVFGGIFPMIVFGVLFSYWNESRPCDKDSTPKEVENEMTRRSSMCVWLISAVAIAVIVAIKLKL
jgi:hypothetical protein